MYYNYIDELKQARTFNLTVNPQRVTSKPGEEEKELITRNLTLVTGLTINEFSKYVSPPYSYTWSGGIFDGYRSNDTWIEQSEFALDFDNTIKIEDLLPRCKQFGLVPQIWYKTFSFIPENLRYRLVFFLDQPIKDKKLHEFIALSLLKLFPEADPSCKDKSRFYFGGIESNIISTEPISTKQFIDALSINLISSDSNSLRKLPLDSEYFTSLSFAEKRDLLYYIYRNVHFSANKNSTPPTSIKGGAKTIIDFNEARKKVKILDEFLNGRWCSHMELFGLATNLIHIKGGMKLMKETMNKFNSQCITKYTRNNFNILPYVNRMNYYPKPVCGFSPFKEDDEVLDIITTIKDVRGLIKVLEPIHRIELSEAEELLNTEYQDVIDNGEVGKIYLFNPTTAIGKTQKLVNTDAVIALPTNALKNEVADRMEIEYQLTPDRVQFSDDRINNKIEYYYRVGLPKKSMEILYHMVNSKNSAKYYSDDIAKAEQYIMQLQETVNSPNTVLTTHKRALFTDFPHDTLIFDEDPLNSLLEIKELKVSDLFALNMIVNIDGLKNVIDELEKSTSNKVYKSPGLFIDDDEIINRISSLKVDSNIFDFQNSSYYVKDGHNNNNIYYVVKRELPKTKKVIIMSATIPIHIYQELYGDRVEIIDITDVKQQGSVTQYTNRSCSRDGLKNYGKKVSKKVGDKPVLTFKTMRNQFKNPVDEMYFGNCSGYDSLKGKDIAIVGTPHRNNAEYFLTARILGIDVNNIDSSMLFQKVEYNGFRFKFNSFVDEGLRNIQLSLIESDLIQAVGRARTLRTDAHVDLYSNFPLRISDEFIY